jgi:uncharacterized protein YlxW (UPF0749 family)
MNPFEMVVAIVFITAITSVLRARYGVRRDKHGGGPVERDTSETRRMEAEMKQLKERLAVLERITVEKENSLEREIEQLRDRP